jgi:amino acid transporter
MRRYVPLLLVVAALLAGAFIPAVNAPRLWLGFPSLLVWSVAGVALLTPALALVEFGRRRGRAEPAAKPSADDGTEVDR